MTLAEFVTLYNSYFLRLPTTDPGDGYSYWNNAGIITRSIKS